MAALRLAGLPAMPLADVQSVIDPLVRLADAEARLVERLW